MGNTFSSDNCKWCGGDRTPKHTGRPGQYCSTKCRQAAHAERHKAPPPDTSVFDHFLHGELEAARADIRALQHELASPALPAEQPLERLLSLQRRIEQLVPATVGRTKQAGKSWEDISQMLGLNKDTARKKYNPSAVQRSLSRPHTKGPAARPAPRTTPASSAPPGPLPPIPAARPSPADDGPRTEAIVEEPSDRTAAPDPTDFACVLSSLQRASRHSLRTLSKKARLSPSFLSRTMNGERFPSWEATVAIAYACGADPEALRKVWEDADARRRKATPQDLACALRYLHQRAGNPALWSISVTSGYALHQNHIAALLNGTTPGTWEDVQKLVQTLDGECSYFEPLWQQAAAKQPPMPPPAPTATRGTATRLEDLIAAFGKVLSTTGRPTTPRRFLPTPIEAATAWYRTTPRPHPTA
ncbi:helix-turn-helix domain-containing protein [Streptomyces sp. NPDC001750]|uniref:helix-turn-helix domain-containing protein n=1 Tax=Streptomyces sp. NPDC001750 TaxID=3364607 RepID=UPI0036C1DAC7